MVEVIIDSIRVSLISQQRIVMLRDADGESQLPIWVGPCEADAIAVELQDHEVARPLTHDLLKNTVEELGGTISHILISELRDSVFHARLYVKSGKQTLNIDCRPSDAIAVAIRANVPIYVNDDVMDEAGILPEPDISEQPAEELDESIEPDPEIDADLDAFRDFLSNMGDE